MGYTSYNNSTRSLRAASKGYSTKSINDTFVQQKVGLVHESLNPKGLVVRECCDSESHPNTIPILLGLDVTGSMGHIPHQLVKEGLPTLMTTLIDSGLPDASLCFSAVGDHFSDRGPFQIAQFESGDAELDDWLTKTWLEGNGGGNGGESYMLPWYAATRHIKTDAYDNRNQKGFIITIGNEPIHESIDKKSLEHIFGSTDIEGDSISAVDLLEQVRNKWNVFHIHINRGYYGDMNGGLWGKLLGENLITIEDYNTIPEVISELVLKNTSTEKTQVLKEETNNVVGVSEETITL
mgnify:CR=1 FL=1